MKVAVLHGEVPKDAPADEKDVLVEAGAVSEALRALGHDAYDLPVSLDLGRLASELAAGRPDVVFNLVESLGGKGSLIHIAPSILDSIGIPYTGSPTEAVFMTSSKLLAKRTLRAAGIPTPGWFDEDGPDASGFAPGRPYIVKSVWEHASIGIEEDAVSVYENTRALAGAIASRRPSLGGACFAEQYIEGREFNISLMEMDGGPVVLPPAEIRFVDFPEGSRRMVGYRAKWVEDSPEYQKTVRSFVFPESDALLLGRVAEISRECWRLFGLGGYARVDFRVDEDERPYVLEVNINPCISPDSGFVAAASMAGYGYNKVVSMILYACVSRARGRRALS